MKKKALLIYPNNLFEDFDFQNYEVFLLEDPLFFLDKKYPLNFHKLKLFIHRASFKSYESYLKTTKNIQTKYIDYKSVKSFYQNLKALGIKSINIFKPYDFILEKRLRKYCIKFNIELAVLKNPSFLTEEDDLINFEKTTKRTFFHQKFYIWQRKRLNLLIDENKNPIGGKWSFDTENRKKLSKNIVVPKSIGFEEDEFRLEAKNYVEMIFPDNLGSLENAFFDYPINHTQSKKSLDNFLKTKFKFFGDYEDSIEKTQPIIFHSQLSLALNTGLLTPRFVVDEAINFGLKNNIPLNSLEGFIRQIIGWREFMAFVYEKKGTSMRNSNFFNHQNKLNKKFYNGQTGIAPIDDNIQYLKTNGYSHHIIRLMIFGNFFLLIELNPTEVYKWFMGFYIDSYDWVMVPNVYGMSQFADGGSIVTKPYFSGSNYIKKMSSYKGKEISSSKEGRLILTNLSLEFNKEIFWEDIWDGLFWRFFKKNIDLMRKNPRMSLLSKNIDTNLEKIQIANKYIQFLFK